MARNTLIIFLTTLIQITSPTKISFIISDHKFLSSKKFLLQTTDPIKKYPPCQINFSINLSKVEFSQNFLKFTNFNEIVSKTQKRIENGGSNAARAWSRACVVQFDNGNAKDNFESRTNFTEQLNRLNSYCNAYSSNLKCSFIDPCSQYSCPPNLPKCQSTGQFIDPIFICSNQSNYVDPSESLFERQLIEESDQILNHNSWIWLMTLCFLVVFLSGTVYFYNNSQDQVKLMVMKELVREEIQSVSPQNTHKTKIYETQTQENSVATVTDTRKTSKFTANSPKIDIINHQFDFDVPDSNSKSKTNLVDQIDKIEKVALPENNDTPTAPENFKYKGHQIKKILNNRRNGITTSSINFKSREARSHTVSYVGEVEEMIENQHHHQNLNDETATCNQNSSTTNINESSFIYYSNVTNLKLVRKSVIKQGDLTTIEEDGTYHGKDWRGTLGRDRCHSNI